MEWYLRAFKKYATFRGRAHRREYWMFVVWNLVPVVALLIVDRALGTFITFTPNADMGVGTEPLQFGVLGLVYALAVLIPSTAIVTRRLHDIGRSGWWQLLAIIPFVGAILLLVWLVQQGQTGPNRFGSDPRLVADPVK